MVLAMSLFDRVGRFLDDVVLLPDETRKSLDAADQAVRDGLWPEAEALYADVLDTRPSLLRARVGLARVLAQTGRISEARAALDLARREAPDDARVATLAAEWALTQGDAAAAAGHARAAARTLVAEGGAEFAHACALRARAELALGRPDRAARELEKALSVRPDDADLAVEALEALCASRAPRRARAAARRLVPGALSPVAATRVGLALVDAGLERSALRFLERAASSSEPRALEALARARFADGDLVEAGQVLVDLSGRAELAGLEEARAAYREAEQQMHRQQQLTDQKLVPASQLDTQRAAVDSAKARLDATRARLSDRVITAPFSGVLGFRRVSPGTLVTPGTTITSLDDISLIKLDFSIPESYLRALAAGQAISAHSAAYPGRDFTGVVRTLGSRVDPITRAIAVRAEIANGDHALRPGMLLTVDLWQPQRRALAIPEIAVVQVAREAFVFRLQSDHTVARVLVTLGLRRNAEVEVLSGLHAGDRIVVDGTIKLRPGSLIEDVTAATSAATAGDADSARNR